MTSYLGPDNPPLLSLISENYQRFLQVSKTSNDDEDLFDLGDLYYSKITKLLRLQAGINIDDTICVVASRKSKLPKELEKRLCLLFPVVHLSAGTSLFEDSPQSERGIHVATLPINAESYFNNDKIKNQFDKIIIADGLELIENISSFLENVKNSLKDSRDSNLIILHRTKEILSLPLFTEIIEDFENRQIDIQVLLEYLLNLDFLVGWNIVSLPIQIPKTKWFNQLYNHYPPIMEVVATTDIYGGLRELVETSFKYSDFLVRINDRMFLIVASISDMLSGHKPYKMHLLDDDLMVKTVNIPQQTNNNLLWLCITPDIRNILPKNLESIDLFKDIENNYPEEWWGTIPSASMGQLDRSRINHSIKKLK